MTTRPTCTVKIIVGILAGMAGMLALATLWHQTGLAAPPTKASYPYTDYLMNCRSWSFTASYLALSIVLGLVLRRSWPVALGMIGPFALALTVELQRDPTSHNLFPFEIVLNWAPVFAVSWLGAYLGKTLIVRCTRPPEIPPPLPQ
jgi:hypothetical protein